MISRNPGDQERSRPVGEDEGAFLREQNVANADVLAFRSTSRQEVR